MTFLIIAIGILAAGLLSWTLTRYFLSFALDRGIMDIPNGRSSHVTPKPRAGGISFFLIFTSAVFILLSLHLLSVRETLALSCGILIAMIGYWDDRSGLSPVFRIVVHITAAALAVYFLDGLAPIHLGFAIYLPPAAVAVIAVCSLVWLTNLTNFMDGIDGIASVEAITTAGICGILIVHRSGFNGLAILFCVLAAAVAGFLVWNWPPARIYMGDVGSGFLGFTLGVMAYIAIGQHQLSLWPPLILYGVFVIDATLTLCRRILRAERWYAAHRTHAYQNATVRWGHRKVTLSVAAINIFWLVPWAVLADTWPSRGPLLLLCAWTPLVAAAWWLRAGNVSYPQTLSESSLQYAVDTVKKIL